MFIVTKAGLRNSLIRIGELLAYLHMKEISMEDKIKASKNKRSYEANSDS
jgi:hypothetical protein